VTALAGSEVVVAMRERTPFDRALLDRLPGPAAARHHRHGQRRRSTWTPPADRGVLVCGTRSRQAGPAELTWALVLAVTRRVGHEDAAVRAGGWQTTIGPELSGRTLGVLGLGRLGSIVAGYGRAFGMRVLGWSANLDPGHARELGVEPVTLDDLLTRSDVVSVHLKLSDRTRGLLGARELDLIGPDGYLVNTSRGPDRRRGRAGRGAAYPAGSPVPAWTCSTSSRCRPTTRCGRRRARASPRTSATSQLDAYRVFYADAGRGRRPPGWPASGPRAQLGGRTREAACGSSRCCRRPPNLVVTARAGLAGDLVGRTHECDWPPRRAGARRRWSPALRCRTA
jgi:hypothetical protein